MNFDLFNLHPRLLTNLQTLGFKTPTPIQQQAIPAILQNEDLMGLAQTGTGKTAAFVLPLLHKLIAGPRKQVRALVIAPTRELAQQIHEAICELGKDTSLRSIALYGGVNIYGQKQKLKRGVEIVVACPGRLLDHLGQHTINLSQLEILVLDEADQMFDMGFLPSIRKILQQLPTKKQTLLFSATMPTELRKLAHDILHKPITVQLSNTAPVASVKHAVYPVSPQLKTALLIKLLQTIESKSILVFTRTKQKAKQVAQQLENVGYNATSLQGNLSQSKRKTALNAFRDGSMPILVATDIAARGIDVAHISHVINYDMPDTLEAYTHRIGRTGRANKQGDALTFITREDAHRVRAIERAIGSRIPSHTLSNFDYKESAPQKKSQHDFAGKPKAKPSHKFSKPKFSREKFPKQKSRRKKSSCQNYQKSKQPYAG